MSALNWVTVALSLGALAVSSTAWRRAVLVRRRTEKIRNKILEQATSSVWLGALSGFEVAAPREGRVELRHRCGWSRPIWSDGVTGAGGAFLANVVQRAKEERLVHECIPPYGDVVAHERG